MALVP